MKKVFLVLALCAVCFITFTAFTKDENSTVIPVPEVLQEKIITCSVDNGFISNQMAIDVRDSQAIQRSFNAFVASGYDPASVTNTLAQIAVDKGYYSDINTAKKAMKQTIEKARQNESNWIKLYKMLDL